MNNQRYITKVLTLSLLLFTIGIIAGCDSINSEESDKDNNDGEIINPANADKLAEVLFMPNGTEKRNDDLPSPTETNDSPITSSTVDEITSSNGATTPLNFEFENVNGELSGCYIQVEGASSYFDVPYPGNSGSDGTLQVPIGIPSNVGQGEFCINFCVYDSENRVSNIVNTCIEVLRLGTGALQISLSWDNTSDLDLHVTDPSGTTIYWSNTLSPTGGELDRDDVDGFGPENIFWTNEAPDGPYVVEVEHFSGTSPANFIVTVTGAANTRSFDGTIRNQEKVRVTSFSKNGDVIDF